MSQQKPKPALSRAPDADLHPVSGRPLPAAIPGGVKDGEGKSKAKSLKPGTGASAADAITGPSSETDSASVITVSPLVAATRWSKICSRSGMRM